MILTEPLLHIRQKVKKLKFPSEKMFHHPAIIVNVGGNRQLNPISFRKSNGSEQYHIIVTGETALPVKPSSLIASAPCIPRDGLHRCRTTVSFRSAQISTSEFS
ncbi:hypothetical protein ILYODFUR_022025 [Ilyodon furcidens]|uniref:Uncharacterized protein n=1 Tax=Ilyodon furcidens TaxID=33524 RepID=A0ABV0TKV7_9TELE